MDAELRTSPYATAEAVDSRLTDPHLQGVVQSAKDAAQRAGYAEGHREGYAHGLEVAATEARAVALAQAEAHAAAERDREARVHAALEVLDRVTTALQAREAVAVHEVEDAVTDLALQISAAVLTRELALSTDPGRDALARALALAPRDAAVTARLHPADAASLAGVDSFAGRPLHVVADPAVEPGGCVVDTAGRQIDAQVGPALARVAAVLRPAVTA
jgi:flagellar assembly protein FliH